MHATMIFESEDEREKLGASTRVSENCLYWQFSEKTGLLSISANAASSRSYPFQSYAYLFGPAPRPLEANLACPEGKR
jgi:hypothetical protein